MNARFLLPLAAAVALAAPASAHLEDGQVWLIDYVNDSMYRVRTSDWAVFTTLGPSAGLAGPGGIGFNLHGHMLLLNYDTDEILEWDGDSAVASVVGTAALGVDGPFGANTVVVGPGHGDVYIGNYDSGEILVLDDELTGSTVFADAADGLIHPVAMQFLADGHLVVANQGSGGDLLLFHSDGSVDPFDNVGPAEVISLTVRDNGDLYALTDAGRIYRYAGGDPLARSVLGAYPDGPGGIEFDYDFSRLYHVNQGTGELRTIDPDTGADVVRVTLTGKRPYAIAVTGGEMAHGTFKDIGGDLAGTGGISPLLESHDEPRIGEPGILHLENFVGGTVAWTFLGLGFAELPAYGGELHVDISGGTFWTVKLFGVGGTPGLAGDGHVDLPFTLPADPVLVGSQWWMQALAPDAGAVFGVSFSNALKMYVGDSH